MSGSDAIGFDISSPEFISYSCNSPVQNFHDIMSDVTWEYRIGGNDELREAVILIPGICESTNSMYLIASGIISMGYRVIVVSIPPYTSLQSFLVGFDLLIARLQISKVHLVGDGLGGFLALHIASFKSLTSEVSSITVISSFMNTRSFKKYGGILSSVVTKSNLYDELCISQVPANLKPSVSFVSQEIDRLDSSLVEARLALRSSAPPAPIPQIEGARVMVIQPIDWAYRIDNATKPNKAIPGAKIAMMKSGGFFPHLSSSAEVLEFLKVHLRLWHSALPEEEEESRSG